VYLRQRLFLRDRPGGLCLAVTAGVGGDALSSSFMGVMVLSDIVASFRYNHRHLEASAESDSAGVVGKTFVTHYNLSDDEYVIRKHAHMLANAGVDVIIFDASNFDVTNNTPYTYHDRCKQLCEVYRDMRSKGNRTPQIAFLAPFSEFGPDHVVLAVHELFDNFYCLDLYSELWFKWDGKPLILADKDVIDTTAVRDFFTYRKPNPSLFVDPAGPDEWGWCSIYPQSIYTDYDNN
jgi:hypothetical protein